VLPQVTTVHPARRVGVVLAVAFGVLDLRLAYTTITSEQTRIEWVQTPTTALVVLFSFGALIHLLIVMALSERLDRGPGYTEHSLFWRKPARITDDELVSITSTGRRTLVFRGQGQRSFAVWCSWGTPKDLPELYTDLATARPNVIQAAWLRRSLADLGVPGMSE